MRWRGCRQCKAVVGRLDRSVLCGLMLDRKDIPKISTTTNGTTL